MYDPESAFRLEMHLEGMQASTMTIREAVGYNHPFTKVCESFNNALMYASEMVREYNDCWDEEQKELLRIELNELLNGIQEQLAEFTAIVKNDLFD